MTRKHFIELADEIIRTRKYEESEAFSAYQVNVLADFCKSVSPNFDRAKWLEYIAKGTTR